MKMLMLMLTALWGVTAVSADPRAEMLSYLNERSLPLDTPADLDPLLERIGDAQLVLLGEASHGTSEYYTWRAEISKRLIAEKGFDFIAVEGDWPSCYEVNRYVKHLPGAADNADAALEAFKRWPPWMWANRETADLAQWLAEHNADLPAEQRAGFFGIDVYSLPESMQAVMAYAREHAEDLSDEIAAAYRCLERFGDNLHDYARFTMTGQNCADEAQAVLSLLKDNAERLSEQNRKAFFNAKQNAYVVKRAEMHYRAMAEPQANSWNKRAEHMKATVARLLDEHGPDARGIVWAHNTHIGDARATDMAMTGMKNIGWLTRQRYGADNVVAVGFTTHRGQVLAGRQWGAAMETMTVPPAMGGSVEDIFNALDKDSLMVIFDDAVPEALLSRLGHRAKGVTYNPEAEQRNYVPTILPRRYDVFVFIAETSPLTMLDTTDAEANDNNDAPADDDNADEPEFSYPPQPPAADERQVERRRMVENQIAAPRDGRNPIQCPKVQEAMRRVPRHVMVPETLRRHAYDDSPLPIGHGQTISQPYIVATMTELLDLSPDDKVLEIGTGSGYQAAVLAHITPHVYSIEIIEPLLSQARRMLTEQDYGCIRVKHGDGYHGWAEHAPFDAIIVTCAAGHLPPPLWAQLKEGGRIVVPIGGAYEVQRLVVITKQDDGSRRSRTVMPVRFVPMTRLEEDGD